MYSAPSAASAATHQSYHLQQTMPPGLYAVQQGLGGFSMDGGATAVAAAVDPYAASFAAPAFMGATAATQAMVAGTSFLMGPLPGAAATAAAMVAAATGPGGSPNSSAGQQVRIMVICSLLAGWGGVVQNRGNEQMKGGGRVFRGGGEVLWF